MNTSGEAAEQIVRMSLQGVEVGAKITGAGAKNIAILLYSILKQQGRTKGKARLTSMLNSGKELKVFTVKKDDLKKFTQEAKKYGVLYCVLADRRNKDPNAMVDVIARAEDAPKINRIVERFELSAVDTGSIVNEVEKNKAVPETTKPEKNEKEKLLDELMGKPMQKEDNVPTNPTVAKTEKPPQSEPTSEKLSKSVEGATRLERKPSVKEDLRKIKASRREQKADAPTVEKNMDDKYKNPLSKTEHKQPTARKKSKNLKDSR